MSPYEGRAHLAAQAPSKACKVYDVFKLERQSKLTTCCARVDQDAVASILAVWAGENWPETLEAPHARAQDLVACGLSLGKCHIGYRCDKTHEMRNRGALGEAAKSSWVLNGVPVAFSSGDANALFQDLGLSQSVQEHTRRFLRTTQSWIIHLEPTEKPKEDTLHLTHAGKEYFITLTPTATRAQRNPIVQQYSKPSRSRPPPLEPPWSQKQATSKIASRNF